MSQSPESRPNSFSQRGSMNISTNYDEDGRVNQTVAEGRGIFISLCNMNPDPGLRRPEILVGTEVYDSKHISEIGEFITWKEARKVFRKLVTMALMASSITEVQQELAVQSMLHSDAYSASHREH